MKIPSLPPNEEQRLEVLKKYEILDTDFEKEYDEIVRLASLICQTPMALVSLVDENRQWFKAKKGVENRETHRDFSFCAHAIHQKDLFVVHDTLLDERFVDNPMVIDNPNMRFYAGKPLTTQEGYGMGTLCVVDTVPRVLTEAQKLALEVLANQVIAQLELKVKIKQLQEQEKQLHSQYERLREVQIALKQSQDKLIFALEGTNIGVWEAPFGENRFYWDKTCQKIFNLPPQASFEEWHNVIKPEFIEEALNTPDKFLKGEVSSYSFEYQTKPINGVEKYIFAKATMLKDRDGKPVSLIGTIEDITESKKLRLELQNKAEELAKANASKDKVFSIIGHDLRNPIGSLKGLLDLLVGQHITVEDFMQFATNLLKGVDGVYFTLNNLLTWAQSQMQELHPSPQWIELNKIIRENFSFLSTIASQKNIVLENNSPEVTLAWADSNHIHLVFRNLISNALKFTPEKGKISINMEEGEQDWVITVQDTGVGMSQDIQNKLFKKNDSFTTLGTQNEKGTGLGLLLCQEMLEKNRGKIWVESTVGKGTTFYFTVPKEIQ